MEPRPLSDTASFSTTDYIVLLPCEHAFEEDAIDEALDEIRELERLGRELRRETDPNDLKFLKEYAMPVQQNKVNQRARSLRPLDRDISVDDERVAEAEEAIEEYEQQKRDRAKIRANFETGSEQ